MSELAETTVETILVPFESPWVLSLLCAIQDPEREAANNYNSGFFFSDSSIGPLRLLNGAFHLCSSTKFVLVSLSVLVLRCNRASETLQDDVAFLWLSVCFVCAQSEYARRPSFGI